MAEPTLRLPPGSTLSHPTVSTVPGTVSSHLKMPSIFRASTVMLALSSHASPAGTTQTTFSAHCSDAFFHAVSANRPAWFKDPRPTRSVLLVWRACNSEWSMKYLPSALPRRPMPMSSAIPDAASLRKGQHMSLLPRKFAMVM